MGSDKVWVDFPGGSDGKSVCLHYTGEYRMRSEFSGGYGNVISRKKNLEKQ